jgi:carboxymethylenebutenolidase
MGKMIELTASDGQAFRLPRRLRENEASRAAGLSIQEIFGVNSHIKSVADGFAADGYLAIAPAMFDRVQKNFDVGYTPPEIEKGRALRAKITVDMAMKDAEAAVKEAAKAGKVGIVGYCWGGFVAWMVFRSAVLSRQPYYGGRSDNADIEPCAGWATGLARTTHSGRRRKKPPKNMKNDLHLRRRPRLQPRPPRPYNAPAAQARAAR